MVSWHITHIPTSKFVASPAGGATGGGVWDGVSCSMVVLVVVVVVVAAGCPRTRSTHGSAILSSVLPSSGFGWLGLSIPNQLVVMVVLVLWAVLVMRVVVVHGDVPGACVCRRSIASNVRLALRPSNIAICWSAACWRSRFRQFRQPQATSLLSQGRSGSRPQSGVSCVSEGVARIPLHPRPPPHPPSPPLASRPRGSCTGFGLAVTPFGRKITML